MKIHEIKLSKREKKRANEFEAIVDNRLVPLNCLLCEANNSAITIFSNYDRYGFNYPTGICSSCGNIQQAKYYSDYHLKIFYEKYYRDIYGSLSPSELFDHQYDRSHKVFEFCEDYISINNGKILEIGTGSGGILARFRDSNFEVEGIDLDERYMEFARNKGLPINYGDIDSLSIDDSRYQMVIICHVLEHIKDPKEFLNKIKKLLKKESFLYIEVPIIESVLNGAYRGLLGRYFQNAHVSHFSIDTLKAALEIIGFQIVKYNDEGRFLVKKCIKEEGKLPNGLFEKQNSLLSKLLSKQKLYFLRNPFMSIIYFIYDLIKPLFKK